MGKNKKSNVNKNTRPAKSEEVKAPADVKETRDAKDAKGAGASKDVKDAKDATASKDVKDAKGAGASKDAKDAKSASASKDAKETKASQAAKAPAASKDSDASKEEKGAKAARGAKEPKKEKKKKVKMPMSMMNKILLTILAVAVVAFGIYLAYYVKHYVSYTKFKDYLTAYDYEPGTAYSPVAESVSDVPGYELVAESGSLKLYTDTKSANIAIFDKRNGETTYSNPAGADEDTVANAVNKSFMKSQFLLYYYNADVISGSMNSFADSVAKGQYSFEGIANGIRYIYTVGDLNNIHFQVPLEYRLEDDHLEVSIPVDQIQEFNNGFIYRIQLLRYMDAASYDDKGYMVVPNGSGSIINFNNGKKGAENFSQYVYDIDPLAANYTTLENLEVTRLPIYGICKEKSSLLVSIEDGAASALISAVASGTDCDYNYAYPSFVLRVADNLRMFGNSDLDVYVMEQEAYDIHICVRYTFIPDENAGYSGIANCYRNRLVQDGVLTAKTQAGDIPFYYDVIGGVKETDHFLGVQYLHTFSMTDFDQAGQISDRLAADGITNQVMNLQGWFNGGYYHDAAHNIKPTMKLGGKSGLEELNQRVKDNGGKLYADTCFQRVTRADKYYPVNIESSRYYGAGYVATFGQINPSTLRNTSGLGYSENLYSLVSPKFLPRYVEKFSKKITNYDVDGVSLRDLGDVLTSDKKRTNQINREQALDIVLGQFDTLQGTGKSIMTNAANDYAFAYSDDIINVPLDGSTITLTDADIPLYEMILHGYIPYSSGLLNFDNADDADKKTLALIEAGASPHYVFTWKDSSEMKLTALNRYYTTTFANWEENAAATYEKVNSVLSQVSGSPMTEHVILENGVRRVTYGNGVIIYLNYSNTALSADGLEIPAMGYLVEGR